MIKQVSYPERLVISKEEILNTFDNLGTAVKAILECGHECILTGSMVQDSYVDCAPCQAESHASRN